MNEYVDNRGKHKARRRSRRRIVVVLLVLGAVAWYGWGAYQKTDGYLSGQSMKQALQATEDKRYDDAVVAYQRVIDNEWPDQQQAGEAQQATYALGLADTSAEQVAALVEYAPQTGRDELVEMSITKGRGAVETFERTDLRGAAAIVGALRYLVPADSSLLKQRISILERLVAQEPDALGAKEELAEVYYDSAGFDRVIDTLEPVRGQLGATTRGALFLGKALSQKGHYEQAIPLLSGYVEPALEQLARHEANYTRLAEAAYQKAFQTLNEGQGSEAFYAKYNEAGEAEQQMLLTQEIHTMMDSDQAYSDAIIAYQEANEVVPHAFDLGIAQLFHARNLPPGDDQTQGLKAAEQTFLALQGAAGESDEYRLFLGQVKYWLGKEEEGSQLFEKLLEANDRNSESLLMVGGVMRELGEQRRAGDIFEEAFEKGQTELEKQNAATLRALTISEPEEQIVWLERCDQSLPQTQVRIANAKARIAKDAGDMEGAIEQMRVAVDGYDKMGDDQSTLNNRSLAYQELFSMTGDPQDYQRGAEEMARALELNPNDGIIVSNALTTMMDSAVIQVLGERFDFRALQGAYSNRMLQMLYADQAGYEAITEQLVAVPAFERARALADRVRLIAPKSAASYTLGMEYYWLANQPQQVAKIGRSMKGLDLDTTAVEQSTRDMWAGTDREDDLEQLRAYLKTLEDSLADLTEGTLEHDYQILRRALGETSLATFEGSDPKLFGQLRKANKIRLSRPCRYADKVVYDIYLTMADQKLRDTEPAYADMAKKTNWGIGAKSRVCWALVQEGAEEKWLEDVHLKSAFEILAAHIEKMPSEHSAFDWAMAQAYDAELGQRVRDEIVASEHQLARLIAQKAFNPIDGAAVIEAYLLYRLMGDEAQADQVLAAGREAGIPLP